MNLTYYELQFEIILKKDLTVENLYEEISKGINHCLNYNQFTKSLHQSKTFKPYCYFLYDYMPVSVGKKCRLFIRCMGEELKNNLITAVIKADNYTFSTSSLISEEVIEFNSFLKRITLKSITPTVLKDDDDKFLNVNSSEEYIIKKISQNLIRKYNMISGESLDTDTNIIKKAKTLNKTPLSTNYKGGKISGNKYIIEFLSDEISQKIAFIAMVFGIGSRNSLGFGTCKASNEYRYIIGD